MSRIGKKTYKIPEGVEVEVESGVLKVKGPKGELVQELHPHISIAREANSVNVKVKKEDDGGDRALWGLFGSLLGNMLTGVTQGFEKKLEINGIGYKASITGKKLVLSLGFSHDIEYDIPGDVNISVEKNIITVNGISKQRVGQVAAQIRGYRKPEPYLGKGIKYLDEVIRRKQGKAATKAGA